MYTGQYVFAQVMEYLPWPVFRRCVARYGGDHKIKSFSCLDQFRCLAFAQLTWRESLRDIEACLRAQSAKLYHLGFRCPQISRNTMASANAEPRDAWDAREDGKPSCQVRIGLKALHDLHLDSANLALDLFQSLGVVTFQDRERQSFGAIFSGGAVFNERFAGNIKFF